MKMKRRLVSIVLMLVLLFTLSIGVFAGDDDGPTRPQFIRRSIITDPNRP
ncbi:hypothetical protein [Tissierella sp.]|nr:hypothetical protein [Tissierella sp.]MDR7857401.1 hypothetical protein [Tissierella sp.]